MSSPYKKTDNLHTLKRTVEGNDFFILLNPEIGSWAVFSSQDYQRYENNELNETEWETLYLRGLCADDSGNMVEMDFPQPHEIPSVVVVNISTMCNLRCKYCFADCAPTKGENMTEDVMESLVRQMFELPSPMVTFEFQGGEALCHLEGMKRFVEISEELNKQFNKRVIYRTMTNCTLISEEFMALVKRYNFNVGISIDGPKEMTDKVRIDEFGHGVFDRIMDGVKTLRDNGIEIDGAVCTIGQHNVHYPEEIVNFFAANNIKFKPRPVNVLGRELYSRLTTKPGEWAEAYKKMYYRSKELGIENASIHIFEENVYTPIRDYVCLRYPCGAAREIISVNPNGDVFPCDGFKGEDTFKMGNILTESLKEILEKESVCTLRNRTAKDIKKCSTCLYRAMCCSCCYSSFGKYGSIYREDPHCADKRLIFNFIFDEWIKNNILKH